MSEYEKINAGVKLSVTARRKEAVKGIILTLFWVVVALAAFIGLKAIGFISFEFMVVLMLIAVCAGAFKTGYIWHDIKF